MSPPVLALALLTLSIFVSDRLYNSFCFDRSLASIHAHGSKEMETTEVKKKQHHHVMVLSGLSGLSEC